MSKTYEQPIPEDNSPNTQETFSIPFHNEDLEPEAEGDEVDVSPKDRELVLENLSRLAIGGQEQDDHSDEDQRNAA